MRREDLLSLAAALARPYRLSPPRLPSGGMAGAFTGQRDGQSVDFHDFREYQPGDDLRRVDWRAYARNGQMHLRLFRAEVSPVVELHLDTSASMAAYPGKEQALLFLAAFLRFVTLAAEGRPILCRDGLRFGGGDFEAGLMATKFDGDPDARTAAILSGDLPLRFCLSDYLLSDGLAPLINRFASGTLHFCPVMLLSQSETEPPWRGFHQLRDIERPRESLDLNLGAGVIGEYLSRLRRHEETIANLARRHGARLLRINTPDRDAVRQDCEALVRRLAGERLVTAR